MLNTQAEVREWIDNMGDRHVTGNDRGNVIISDSRWTKPPFPYVKCNFDAGFNAQTFNATGGWIIRDHEGTPKDWGSSNLPHVSTPLEAETKALLVAIQQAWLKGYRRIIFEGDCEILINTINGASKQSAITNLLLDIDYWTTKLGSATFCFTKRSNNRIAHHLASSNCLFREYYSDSGSQPLWLRRLLCNDIII